MASAAPLRRRTINAVRHDGGAAAVVLRLLKDGQGPRMIMETQPFKLGVFMPVANNGWIISKTAPQYVPSFELNKEIAQHAEEVGFDYVFSMAKWTGYGGATEYWDHSIESLILMTALAPVTRRLRLVASVAPVLIHPTIVAKMAVHMDHVPGGPCG